ncbi:Spo11/DNA topoisomerase VI subunit A [Xylaria bambusicola]|uniref:Spo11/DNA topoisomerase VI subunit A n=1 Tax=Xylaria bambusicola TaxID=326684 RepID=UPI002007DA50|nr:Spo11/DNA topoisomerase VI subunit A [Xylaria bambusicola]KAI0508931.1 Spo11/DNA topoisomerase VI subunit A [Xylaria bambusicola]
MEGVHSNDNSTLGTRPNQHTGTIISNIESILVANLEALREARPMSIPIRSRMTGNVRLVRFPSTRRGEARKFTAILSIIHLCHEALIAGRVITKRDIYYQNPELYGNQDYVNRLVDDLAFTFDLGRDALNIVAAVKGLIVGGLKVIFHDDSTLYCNPHDRHNILIPETRTILGFDLGTTKWLLVIEKEATFRGLAASRFHELAAVGPGLLVTAKGYPDLSTRQFLHKLQTSFPLLPMFGLVDFDPHGVHIMLTYKNGSRSLQHEQNTILSRLTWLGPRSSDVLGFRTLEPAPTRECTPVDTTLPLRIRERRVAVKLLSSAIESDDEFVANNDLIRELQIMLLLNTKAEIQAVDDAGDLTKWLDNALTKEMKVL